MKTHTIKTPTAELLIVQLPHRTAEFSVLDTGEALAVCAFDENDDCLDVKGISKGYTLLGKPDEIREDHAKELVKQIGEGQTVKMDGFKNYKNEYLWCKTATESLLSALESDIFWDVNPLGEYDKIDWFKASENTPTIQEWNEAQSRTFDRSRSIILAKQ